MLRILFFGTAQFAVPALERLLARPDLYAILGVVTQPDKPAGRGRHIRTSPVAEAAGRVGLPLLQPKTLKDEEVQRQLAALSPDLLIVAAYGKILPKTVLDLARIAPLNLHGSLLPKYRGASPIQAAILEGEGETGVSLMRMDEEIDHGPVYAAVSVTIADADTAETLERKLADAAAALLLDHLPAIVDGSLAAREQNHGAATFTNIIDRDDGMADWKGEDAIRLERKLRAYTPWPGLHASWRRGNDNAMRIKIIRAAAIAEATGIPGKVFVAPSGNPAVYAKSGALELIELQPEGKKPMSGMAFMNGYRDFASGAL